MKKYIIIVFVLSLIGFVACEDFLAEQPKTTVTEANFFGPDATQDGVEQFINGIYPARFWTIQDRRWSWFATVPADEFNHTVAYDVEGQQYDEHFFEPSQFNIFRQWDYLWWPIARVNTFDSYYQYLETTYGSKWANLKRFRGEALFHRAFNYFIGVQMWGPIPLILVAPDGKNYGNSTEKEVYAQIIKDLKEVIDNNYLPNWKEYPAKDKGRITRGAPKALLAKVYLQKSYHATASEASDIGNAVLYAKDVIDNEGYGLITTSVTTGTYTYTAYESAFLPENKNGKEDIYSYQFSPGSSQNGVNLVFVPRNWFGAWGDARLEATPLLYNSFEAGDLRKNSYITGTVVSPHTGLTVSCGDKIYMTKIQDSDPKTTPQNHRNNWPIIRYADILLVYAEALNKQNNGPTPAAFDAINSVRTRAGLPGLTGANTYDTFLKAVQDERFKELAGEGHRLVDLRRWGYNTLKERVELSQPKASVEPHEILYPIPSEEMGLNPLMKQNQGY
jgi:hypothetical protein